MHFKEIQRQQAIWEQRNFPDVTTDQIMIGIAEEVGELAHAHLKLAAGIRMNEGLDAKLKDAIGDIAIFLIAYCNLNGLDFSEIVYKTWETVRSRDWIKNPINGEVDGTDTDKNCP